MAEGKTEPPKGELYSRLYIERGKPLPDSQRFRIRLANYYQDHLRGDFRGAISSAIPRELGVDVPYVQNYGLSVVKFFKEKGTETHDVLSAITLIYRIVNVPGFPRAAPTWKAFVQRALQEENLAYTLDDECGVHPLVDLEFEKNLTATISGLGAGRYAAVRTAFQAGKAKLEQTPADLKGAIRDVFEAAETLTKLVVGTNAALDAGFAGKELMAVANRVYGGLKGAEQAGPRMVSSFAKWVDAAHPYRHGQQSEEPVAPPEDLAILLVSQGASFIRWLVDLDQQANAGSRPPAEARPRRAG